MYIYILHYIRLIIPQPSQSMDSYIPNGHDDNASPFPIIRYSGWIHKFMISRVHWENAVYDAQYMIIISFTQRLFVFVHTCAMFSPFQQNQLYLVYTISWQQYRLPFHDMSLINSLLEYDFP